MTGEPPVLFITRKWAPATGGMETYCLRLTEELAGLVGVEVVALKGQANGMPPRAWALLLFPFTVIARLLRRRNAAQVMHLGDMALWPLGLLAARRTIVVLSAHGTDIAYHRRGGWRGGLYGAYLRLGSAVLRRARVIANSQATAEMLGQTGWTAHSVIPLATHISAAGPPPIAPEPAILFAGRLVPRKGCGWFIANVLPLLPQAITLRVAGTGWDAGELAALDHPRVRFLGALDQQALAREYAAALCVVVPNIEVAEGEYEGFGLVAPEAASAGGVVLAARCGGLTDAVIDGETGFLLASGDAGVWAAKIIEVQGWDGAQRASFTARARASAAAHFNWQRVARQTIEAYAPHPLSQQIAAPAAI